MKSETNKSKKQHQTTSSKNKPTCGTLSYLAECRGLTKKTDLSRWTSPPDSINKIVRKYPAAT
jgi:hypothetical protein